MKRIVHFSIALLAAFVAARAAAQANNPSLDLYSPADDETVTTPVSLKVNASENANTVLTVEYFANGQSIGVVSNNPIFYTPGSGLIISTIHAPPLPLPFLFGFSPFILPWNAQPGHYTLTAQVTDDQGNSANTAPINVTVIPMPLVSVEATESMASPNGPGIFTISRTGDTNSDLHVPFFLLGTAQNGVDYVNVSNSVTIPAGEFSTDVAINPLVYVRGNTKAVSLKLWNYLIPGGGGPGPVPQVVIEHPPFLLGSPSEATIYIKANERDTHKPAVKITQPSHGHQLIPAGSDITITADAIDRDTYVTLVEFFDGATKLGEAPAQTTTTPGQHVPFNFTWINAPIGRHALHARATDSQGKMQVSAPVRIQVLPAP